MVDKMVRSRHSEVRPLSEWGSIATELLGTQTRLVQGPQWTHRVIECGDGAPLFLLHGIGGHAEAWARNVRNLAELGFHVYAVDALYHGYSSTAPRVPAPERAALQADAVADLVQALGHDRVHIEGESMGADIAYEFGVRHPGLTGKLVLNTGFPPVTTHRTEFAPAPGGGKHLLDLAHEAIATGSRDAMRRRMEWLVAKPDRMTDEMVDLRCRLYAEPQINAAMRYVFGMDAPFALPPRRSEEEIARMTRPTLVLWTENNPGFGPDYGEYVAGLLPDSAFYRMRDAGHWPQWEKPDEHDAVVADFLLGSWPAP
ncbi:2-hydroxy-6-ketonona-2,4-dienedioic acid hydrolase [Frankia sp. Hr75.2]|nr:2-hydroxy-6-ketonona-2,4-dienedioic acid hydrolase [Frankia sp. Hr75.2]